MSVIHAVHAAPVAPSVLDALREAVGPRGWVDDPGAIAAHLSEERGILVKGNSVLIPGVNDAHLP
ncbi:MAG TPA: hypothetical protein PK694_10985, partial [Rhodospirillales bacterium]|nr:hypothetical protein [Rhodospirillales bacterium]